MATIAAFVGIDRHASPDVRDLTGARRDARALSCLFSDSIPDVNIITLCDEQATTDAVRRVMATTLGSATASDTVIFSFSGHGTADHRLVLHDTYATAVIGWLKRHLRTEAITLLTKSEIVIDIVFSAVEIGGPMDGFGLAKWVRANRKGLEIILTGSIVKAAHVAGDLCEEGPHLQKPYEPQQVVEWIKKLRYIKI